MNDDVDLDPTTHMRYIVLPAYSTKGKMLPQKQSGRTATPTNPYGNRWKKGRINCPICGYPLANDIDDKGNFRGLVCMSEGQKGEYTPNNRPRKRCPNFGKIVYKNREEAKSDHRSRIEAKLNQYYDTIIIETGDERKGMSSDAVMK